MSFRMRIRRGRGWGALAFGLQYFNAACTGSSSGGQLGASSCGEKLTLHEAIFGGRDKPPRGQLVAADAVVAIETSTAFAVACSGVLVAPRWVLTARHCFEDAKPRYAALGADVRCASFQASIEKAVLSPEYDAALARLAEDAPALALAPVPNVASSLHTADTADSAGYGVNEDGVIGQRRFLEVSVRAIAASTIEVDGGDSGSCGGDSGGPLLSKSSDSSARILGILLGGSPSCRGADTYLRADALTDWMASVVGE